MDSPSSDMSVAPKIGLARGFTDAGRWAAPGHSARGHLAWLRRRDETFALRLLARQLARAAHRFASLPCRSFRRLFVEASALHLAENAFSLHLLFENPKSLVDIVVANEYLQDLFLSCHGLRRGLPRSSTVFRAHAANSERLPPSRQNETQGHPVRAVSRQRSGAPEGEVWPAMGMVASPLALRRERDRSLSHRRLSACRRYPPYRGCASCWLVCGLRSASDGLRTPQGVGKTPRLLGRCR